MCNYCEEMLKNNDVIFTWSCLSVFVQLFQMLDGPLPAITAYFYGYYNNSLKCPVREMWRDFQQIFVPNNIKITVSGTNYHR